MNENKNILIQSCLSSFIQVCKISFNTEKLNETDQIQNRRSLVMAIKNTEKQRDWAGSGS
jgi:hypothetical protein